MAGPVGRAEDFLRGFLLVRCPGDEDVVNKGLRVRVVQRKPRALDLNHDAVVFEEGVIVRVQVNDVRRYGSGRGGGAARGAKLQHDALAPTRPIDERPELRA